MWPLPSTAQARANRPTDFMKLMKCQGHIVSAGFCGTDDLISLQELRFGELSLDSVSGFTDQRLDRTLDLVAPGGLADPAPHHASLPGPRRGQGVADDSEPRRERHGVILDW